MLQMPIAYAEFYNSPEEYQDWFNSQPKCRYEEKILNTSDVEIDNCSSQLRIIGEHLTLSQLGFLHRNECDGGGGLSIGHSSTEIQNGSTIYGIANKKTGEILYGGKQYYDSYPKIPLCEGQSYLEIPTESLITPQKITIGGSVLVLVIVGIIIYRKYKNKK